MYILLSGSSLLSFLSVLISPCERHVVGEGATGVGFASLFVGGRDGGVWSGVWLVDGGMERRI